MSRLETEGKAEELEGKEEAFIDLLDPTAASEETLQEFLKQNITKV